VKTWPHDAVGILELAPGGEPIAFGLSASAALKLPHAKRVLLRTTGVRADNGARIERDPVAGGFDTGVVQLWARPPQTIVQCGQLNLPPGAYWLALALELTDGTDWPLGGLRVRVA
jgi:hypothetical protein